MLQGAAGGWRWTGNWQPISALKTGAWNTLTVQVSEELKKHYGAKVFDTVIPRNVRIAEAPSYGRPALLHDAQSKGAQAHLAFARELLARWGQPVGVPA